MNSLYTELSYILKGRKPWTTGYGEHREREIRHALDNHSLLDTFRDGGKLPAKYGYRLDERIIEYPWVVSLLRYNSGILLDAGATLNQPYIIPRLENYDCTVSSLSEECNKLSELSYTTGDLRHTDFLDNSFDVIVCISTLEHIGMDNTKFYTTDPKYNEYKPHDYLLAVKEFKRLVKPGGKVLITVPFGKYENLLWLQQFDLKMIMNIAATFGGEGKVSYYKYLPDGWQISSVLDCSGSSYFDIHSQSYESDYVAASRSVACLELKRGE